MASPRPKRPKAASTHSKRGTPRNLATRTPPVVYLTPITDADRDIVEQKLNSPHRRTLIAELRTRQFHLWPWNIPDSPPEKVRYKHLSGVNVTLNATEINIWFEQENPFLYHGIATYPPDAITDILRVIDQSIDEQLSTTH